MFRPLLLLALSLFLHLAAETATTATQAEAIVAQGMTAMRESNQDPKRIVDAAIAFGQALAYYEQQKDTDKICEMQANIFWCKKRMDLDHLNAYLAEKHQDAGAAVGLAKIEQVATATVAASEAQTYFDRAQAFADKHQDDPMAICIRFFEVAERFQGSDYSIKAQRLSLDAQQRFARSLGEADAKTRDTLFSKPAAISASNKANPPSADALKEAVASVKELYKDDYAKTKAKQRQALLSKLLEQAKATTDSPVLRCALISEARDLAIALRDPARTLNAVELMALSFTGVDVMGQKKTALARISGVPAVSAMLKLLDTPTDADANTVAGKYFACEANDWASALPLLAHGSDKALAKGAEMELAKPDSAARKAEVGDVWYDAGKKSSGANRDDLLARALLWYEQAVPEIKGVNHALMVKRIEEIRGLLPPITPADFDHLSAAQWDKIKGPVFEIQANRLRNDTGIKLTANHPYRVIPHPTDTWHITGRGVNLDTSYKGDDTNRRMGTLICYVGNQQSPPGVVNGEGELSLAAEMPRGRLFSASGFIRVKIIPVDDE